MAISAQAGDLTGLCRRGGEHGVSWIVKNSDFCFPLINLASYTGNVFAVREIKLLKIKMRLETLLFFMPPQ